MPTEYEQPRSQRIDASSTNGRGNQKGITGPQAPCRNRSSEDHQAATAKDIPYDKSHILTVMNAAYFTNPPRLNHKPNEKGANQSAECNAENPERTSQCQAKDQIEKPLCPIHVSIKAMLKRGI